LKLTMIRRPLSLAIGTVVAGAMILIRSSQAAAATGRRAQTLNGTTSAGVLSVTAAATLSMLILLAATWSRLRRLRPWGRTRAAVRKRVAALP
jgi:hypothetical protein